VAGEVNVACSTADQQPAVLSQLRRYAESVVETTGGFPCDFIAAASGDQGGCRSFSPNGPVVKVTNQVRTALQNGAAGIRMQGVHVVKDCCAGGKGQKIEVVAWNAAEGLDLKVQQPAVCLVVDGA
jgi:hypothetical protein